MIQIQRSAMQGYVRSGAIKLWESSDETRQVGPPSPGFRALQHIEDVSLPPAARFQFIVPPDRDIVTYVREGGLRVRNSSQEASLVLPGWCQRAGPDPLLTAFAPETAPALKTRLIVTSLRAAPLPLPLPLPYEHKQFPFSDRQDKLRLLASPEGVADSLRLRQDTRLYSALLKKGRHVVHPLQAGRGAWLHVVEGRVRLLDQKLENGDGGSIEDEAAVSFTAQTDSEVLLYDLA